MMGIIYFTRHAKNRMRKFKIDQQTVRDCIKNPKIQESLENRINMWCPFKGKYIRVSIVQEGSKTVVITVTLKSKLKEGLS